MPTGNCTFLRETFNLYLLTLKRKVVQADSQKTPWTEY